MVCKKAIIAVAGYGTRRLPITKSVEKCMMPVGNRPIVDYVVDDCIAAGITDIIFVVGEQSSQIRTYYGHNQPLEDYLVAQHNTEALAQISELAVKARFHFVVQDRDQPYGTSVPMWLSRGYIQPGEHFLFLYGDNIFYKPDGSSAIADFIREAGDKQLQDAMMAVEVPEELVSNYGIIATTMHGRVELFQHIVEKPRPGEAPSNLNNAGCFLLRNDIFPFVERGMTHPGKEQYFTDPLNWYHEAGNDIGVIRTSGEYLDAGTMAGWLHANNRIVGQTNDPPQNRTNKKTAPLAGRKLAPTQ